MSKNYEEVTEFLEVLHQDREFEIFAATEQKDNVHALLFPSTIKNIKFDDLSKFNNQQNHRGIWFTASSMKNGKRLGKNITSLNALVLDKDFNKDANDKQCNISKDYIEFEKSKFIDLLLGLEFKPSIIVESKNGLHIYWLLQDPMNVNLDDYKNVQKTMQDVLKTDKGSFGGERLWRLPEFNHYKDLDDPFKCKIRYKKYDRVFKIEDLKRKYGRSNATLKSYKKKSSNFIPTGKPIKQKSFKGNGNISDIAKGCQLISRIENDSSPKHLERFLLGATYLNLGIDGANHLDQIASQWADYNKNYTDDQISQMVKSGYAAPTCIWCIEKGLCNKKCHQIGNNRKPLAFYFNPWKPVDIDDSNKNVVSTVNTSLSFEAERISSDVIKTLNARGQNIEEFQKNAIKDMAHLIETKSQKVKPIIIPAIPGLGKTTFLISYIVDKLKNNSKFGCILAVERQSSIEEICKEINSHFSKDKAYGMLGYEENYCKKNYPEYRHSQCRTCNIKKEDCRVKYNFDKQFSYPVVIISHERLYHLSEKGELTSKLQHFAPSITNQNGITLVGKYDRTFLFIDERPKLVENIPTTSNQLNEFYSDVQYYMPRNNKEVYRAVDSIKDYYSLPDYQATVTPNNMNFIWSTNFKNDWLKFYKGDNPENIDIVYNLIREGGYYEKADHTVHTTHYANTNWSDFNTFIFDGTANIDPDYKPSLFYFADITKRQSYDNLTINICTDKNLSKTFYNATSKDFIKNFKPDVERISKTGKTYLVCYKQHRDEFETELKGVKDVDIEHFGSTKGANHLRNNVNIICAGILHKGEPYYLSKALTLNRNLSTFETNNTNMVRRFQDENVESVKIYDMVKDLVQEILRTKLRDHSSKTDINAYLVTRNPYLIDALAKYFTGCKINRDWLPDVIAKPRIELEDFVQKNQNSYKTRTKLMKAFFAQYPDSEITNKDVCEVLGVSRKNAQRYLKPKK